MDFLDIDTDITVEFILEKIQDAPLKPSQRAISLPKIKRNIARLRNNERPGPIKVVDGIIVEGHHRYVAGLITGILPDNAPTLRTSALDEKEWKNLKIELTDWGD